MVEQAIFLAENSGIILLSRWDIHSTFIIDQIRGQSDPLFRSEVDVGDFVRGLGFDPKSKRFAIWSLAPATQKDHLMNIQGERRGDRLIWNLQDTRENKIVDLMAHISYMNKNKIVDLQKRYGETYKELVLIANKYEEITKSAMKEEQIKELTKKLANMQSTSHGHTKERVDATPNVLEEFVLVSTEVTFHDQIKI